MNLKVAPLLAALFAAIVVAASWNSSEYALALPTHIQPDHAAGKLVVRLYYRTPEERDALTAFDVLEYNNVEDQYLLLAGDSLGYWRLKQGGYHTQIDRELTDLLAAGSSPFDSGYRTVDEIYARLAELNEKYPNLTHLVKYGQSTCKAIDGCTTPGGEFLSGYDLLALRISNETAAGVSTIGGSAVIGGSKPVFIMLANIHAREIATTEIAMRFIEHLLTNYGRDPNITGLIDWQELWIVPIVNPDGHWLVELGASPTYGQGAFYQRKNANADVDQDGFEDCLIWPPETSLQYGVDLNRNHSYAWGGPGSSGDPCSQTFRGSGPASELEVDSLQSLVQSLIPDQRGAGPQDPAAQSTSGFLVSLHSFGDMILWPWGNNMSMAPNHEGLQAIADKLAAFNHYQSCQSSVCLYSASGTTDDWAYGELGIPAYTFEIGQWFMPNFTDIANSLWPDNLPALLYAARLARMPYETILGPDVYDISAAVAKPGDVFELAATIDAREHGHNKITAANYFVDVPPWTEGAEPHPMAAVDGSFDQELESVSAIIPYAGLSDGNHILYVNARDDDGHWGIVGAASIEVDLNHVMYAFIPLAVANP